MTNSLTKTIDQISRDAKRAALQLQSVRPGQINKALHRMAALLKSEQVLLNKENNRDLKLATEKKVAPAMIDRLTLSDKAVTGMIRGLHEITELTSPVGTIYDERTRPNGLHITKMRVPIGVVGIIYESRPNVTVDAAAICLKSQNAVILRGGSESFYSNSILAKLFSQALSEAGLPKKAIQVIPTTDRLAVELLLQKNDQIDLIIPRGGEGLIRMVVEKSHIPVIKHYKGICHTYVASTADMAVALPLLINAKVQRPGVCNAMETMLLDEKLSLKKRKTILTAFLDQGVAIYGDEKTRALEPRVKKATKKSWQMEYLDLRMSVRTVANIAEAVDHINTYGSHHTDAILSRSKQDQAIFLKQVDSASVMVNASTRFADGGEYGMGCEIGISTDKLHARGPMGIDDLTTYKWIVTGTGQIRI